MVDRSRLDAESVAPLDALLAAMPGGFNGIPDVVQRRATLSAILAAGAAEVPPNPNVTWADHTFDGPGGSLTARVYRPTAATGTLPGLIYIHGGGMVIGDLEGEHLGIIAMCEALGIALVSLDYRKAPENPYPAGPEDCYAGTVWTFAHAAELDIDPSNIGIYGGSAGGGLTLAVALMARDRKGPRLKYMLPIYPMVDDRNVTPSSQEVVDVGLWDRSANLEAWGWYLGGKQADQYAAPTRATDLSNLPPSYIDVGELDMFRDEDTDIAMRLNQAGVPCEFHIYPGAYHGSEVFAPMAVLSQRIVGNRLAAIRRFIEA